MAAFSRRQAPTAVCFDLYVLFLSVFLLLVVSSKADLNADRDALLSLRSSLLGRSLLWNSTTPVCSWQGIVCNNSRVAEIHMPGRSLFGPIPNGVIGNLTALNFLSLRFNGITGTLPSDLSKLTKLQYLYVQGNRFSGEVPAVIFTLPGLIRVNLAGNNFSGEIPADFDKLTQLQTLLLEDNRLTGEIPELNLHDLRQFNVSNNLLNGTIPEKLSIFNSSSFAGNSLCGPPLLSCSSSNGTAGSGGGSGSGSGGGKKKLSGGVIAGIVIGAVVLAALILLCIFFLCCRKKRGDNRNQSREINGVAAKEMDTEMAAAGDKPAVQNSEAVSAAASKPPPSAAAAAKAAAVNKSLVFFGKAPRVYDLDDLLKASAEVLGKGTYGTTYKASLESGMAVAVKRLKDVVVSEDEFRARMEEIGRLDHENLVALRGYHASGGSERLLVYDYLPVGSLSALLHGNRAGGRTPLNWETRSGIALGTARGITYIHSQGPAVSHGNIKSSNVLLATNFEARVSDFGLAQVVTPAAAPNRVAGYRAPEVTDPRKVSQKADVYSFGVFLLELLTGKAPIVNEEGVDLPRWVQSVVKEEWSSEVFDVELLRYQNVEEEMVQLLQLAVDCTAQYPDNRPTMADVTARVEQICRSTSGKSQEQELEESL